MIRITDEQAQDIADQMFRSIDAVELMDLYDREYDDPVEALSATIKDNPFAIIEFLAELVEDYAKNRV